jgi:hypothetical protein
MTSSRSGFAMLLSATLALSGCAQWGGLKIRDDSRDHVEFLAQALAADTSAREQMWRNARLGGNSQNAQLRRALLQSVPAHSGYDPAASESALQGLVDSDPTTDAAAVARLRLAVLKTDVRSAAECRQEVTQLRQRLSQVVDIERKLNASERKLNSNGR